MKQLLVPSLLVTGLLGAQSYVSPVHFTRAEGPAQNSFPFGVTTVPFRYCQVHDDVPAMAIRGMAFRHNAIGTVVASHSVTFDAWMSTAVTNAATIVAIFDNNHGTDKTRVVTNRAYNLPASVPGDVPGPWVLDYPFDVPFPFGGGASLCWEVQVTAKTQAATLFYDALTNGGASPAAQTLRSFTGCLATGRTTGMVATPTSTMDWANAAGSINIAGSNLLANGIVLFMYGFSRTSWSGFPLPFDIPGSTGAPSGTCTVHNEATIILAATASATGTAAGRINFTATPDLNGLAIYGQVWGIDTAANPTGITTSNLATFGILAPFGSPPISRVSLSGSLGASGGINNNVNVLPTLFY